MKPGCSRSDPGRGSVNLSGVSEGVRRSLECLQRVSGARAVNLEADANVDYLHQLTEPDATAILHSSQRSVRSTLRGNGRYHQHRNSTAVVVGGLAGLDKGATSTYSMCFYFKFPIAGPLYASAAFGAKFEMTSYWEHTELDTKKTVVSVSAFGGGGLGVDFLIGGISLSVSVTFTAEMIKADDPRPQDTMQFLFKKMIYDKLEKLRVVKKTVAGASKMTPKDLASLDTKLAKYYNDFTSVIPLHPDGAKAKEIYGKGLRAAFEEIANEFANKVDTVWNHQDVRNGREALDIANQAMVALNSRDRDQEAGIQRKRDKQQQRILNTARELLEKWKHQMHKHYARIFLDKTWTRRSHNTQCSVIPTPAIKEQGESDDDFKKRLFKQTAKKVMCTVFKTGFLLNERSGNDKTNMENMMWLMFPKLHPSTDPDENEFIDWMRSLHSKYLMFRRMFGTERVESGRLERPQVLEPHVDQEGNTVERDRLYIYKDALMHTYFTLSSMMSDARGFGDQIREFQEFSQQQETYSNCLSKLEVMIDVKVKAGLGVSDSLKDMCGGPNSGVAIVGGVKSGMRKELVKPEPGHPQTCQLTDWHTVPPSYTISLLTKYLSLDFKKKYLKLTNGKKSSRWVTAIRVQYPSAAPEEFEEKLLQESLLLSASVVYYVSSAVYDYFSDVRSNTESGTTERSNAIADIAAQAVASVLAAMKSFASAIGGDVLGLLFPSDEDPSVDSEDENGITKKLMNFLETLADAEATSTRMSGYEISFANVDANPRADDPTLNIKMKSFTVEQQAIDGEAFGAFFNSGTSKDCLNTNLKVKEFARSLPGSAKLTRAASNASTRVEGIFSKFKAAFTAMSTSMDNLKTKSAQIMQDYNEKIRQGTAAPLVMPGAPIFLLSPPPQPAL
eukprot:jgi/Bigna1/136304/aug1.33_g11012